MTLRTAFFWLHLTAGVVAGIIVLLMSVTGVALTYERQLIAWSDREFKSTPAPALSGCRSRPGRGVPAPEPDAEPDGSHGGSATRSTRWRWRWGSGPSTWTPIRGGCWAGEPGRPACDVAAARLAPLAGGGRAGAPGRARHHRLGQRAVPVHRGLGDLHVVPAAVVVADGTAGGCCSSPACAARRGTSTGTTPSASGRLFRCSSSWPARCRFRFRGATTSSTAWWVRNRRRRAAAAAAAARRAAAAPAARARRPGARERPLRRSTGWPASRAGRSGRSRTGGRSTSACRSRTDAPVVFAIDRGDGGQPHLRSTLTLTPRGRGRLLRVVRQPDDRPADSERDALCPHR